MVTKTKRWGFKSYVLAGIVSTALLGGTVKKGDFLGLSPLKGVLMKTDAQTTEPIIAIAAASMPTSDNTSYNVQVGGKTRTVHITRTKVNLDRQVIGDTLSQQKFTFVLGVGRAVAGKPVSMVQVIAAIIFFIVVLIAEGSILYAATTSGITALGRNPIAHRVIMRGIRWTISVALVILIVGLLAVYGILRL
jgi:hypothetical protein